MGKRGSQNPFQGTSKSRLLKVKIMIQMPLLRLMSSMISLFLKIPYINKYFEKLIFFSYSVLTKKNKYYIAIKDNFSTDIIIDIGVHTGTPDLYNAFIGSYFILVDPLKENLIDKPVNYEFIEAAVSDKKGKQDFYIFNEEGASSIFNHKDSQKQNLYNIKNKKVVNVITLSSIFDGISSNKLHDNKSMGLKIDVQGSEFDILRPIISFPENLQWIIVENNILNRYNNFSNFSTVTSQLNSKGFRFLNLMQPSSFDVPVAYDALYVKSDNPLFTY